MRWRVYIAVNPVTILQKHPIEETGSYVHTVGRRNNLNTQLPTNLVYSWAMMFNAVRLQSYDYIFLSGSLLIHKASE